MYHIRYICLCWEILLKRVEWSKKALKTLKDFPRIIRQEVGFLIRELQIGKKLRMPSSRPMPIIGKNCHELRVRGTDGSYRIFYFLKTGNKIIIFHAFKKKTQRTPKKEIETGKKILWGILNEKE